jgi:hypothetical protein
LMKINQRRDSSSNFTPGQRLSSSVSSVSIRQTSLVYVYNILKHLTIRVLPEGLI